MKNLCNLCSQTGYGTIKTRFKLTNTHILVLTEELPHWIKEAIKHLIPWKSFLHYQLLYGTLVITLARWWGYLQVHSGKISLHTKLCNMFGFYLIINHDKGKTAEARKYSAKYTLPLLSTSLKIEKIQFIIIELVNVIYRWMVKQDRAKQDNWMHTIEFTLGLPCTWPHNHQVCSWIYWAFIIYYVIA